MDPTEKTETEKLTCDGCIYQNGMKCDRPDGEECYDRDTNRHYIFILGS